MATATEKYIENDDEVYEKECTETDWVAQSFTIGNVGTNIAFNVSSVHLKLKANSSATISAKIFNTNPVGEPTGSALSSGTASGSIFTSDDAGKWGRISVSTFTLQPSTEYALVISGDSFEPVAPRADGSSPSYSGGNVFWSNDSGDTWTSDTTTDLMFQINGADEEGTLCTLGEAIAKAGANAPTNSVSPLLVTQWVKQAESLINVETEYNWVDNYDELNEDVKYILNRVCSAIAAVDIITYDLSSYTDGRPEAETMINVLREESSNGLKLLKDRAKKLFINSLSES